MSSLIGSLLGLVGLVLVYCNVRWQVWSGTAVSVWQHIQCFNCLDRSTPDILWACFWDVGQSRNKSKCLYTYYIAHMCGVWADIRYIYGREGGGEVWESEREERESGMACRYLSTFLSFCGCHGVLLFTEPPVKKQRTSGEGSMMIPLLLRTSVMHHAFRPVNPDALNECDLMTLNLCVLNPWALKMHSFILFIHD